ncbi:DUF3373 family protein [Bdellovibrio sp. HCB290]|uniref:DUF3373 family protein n=1 Tax=Bdellovibrio sp. HCB290 TaxID=3394356 RepID=UPI0039B556C1
MKNNFKKISAAFIAGMLMVPTAQAATLEERVSELEANQSLNIFNFSGTFTTRFDDIIKAEQTQPATDAFGQDATFDSKDLTYLRMKFQFNIDANVSKNIKFYSRLTTSKHFNTFYQQDATSSNSDDLSASNAYDSSRVVLEKAYADFTVADGLTLFVGRLPTVDGQPQNYKDGRARMGTYPMLSYDSVLDGMGLSYKMDQWMPQGQTLAFRALYTPFSQYYAGSSGAYTTTPTTQAGANLPTNSAGYGVMLDYGISDMSWADSMGLVLLNFQTSDIYYASPDTTTLGVSSLTLKVGGTTLAWELNGIAKTGWDLSASYLASTLNSNGQLAANIPGTGFGTSKSDDTNTGSVFLLSTRYRMGSWIFGGEWVNGSENSFYYATATEDLTNFYSTHGNGYHAYVTKKFTQNLAFRVGYMLQDYDYTPTGIGAVKASDRKIETGYANLRLDF